MDAERRARYSADLDNLPAAGPPGNPPIKRIRDVLVIAGDGEVDQGDRTDLILLPKWAGDPFNGAWRQPEPIDLGRGLRLERLDQSESERILNACSPRGHFFVPVRRFGQMYSLVIEIDPEDADEHRWSWNSDGLISDALAMSRLVLDNGYSYEYAARIFDHEGGEQHIMPASVNQAAYRVRKTRDWLTNAEAAELRGLLAAYWDVKADMPDRIDHALWLAEYTVTVRWLDVIAPLLVVAFEALINTSTSLVSRQFQERVSALTEEVASPLSGSQCEKIYDTRSRWVHGRRVSLYQRPKVEGESWTGPTDDEQRAAVERIARTQDSLRVVLRCCIQDEQLRSTFKDEESIRQRWPVSV